MISQVTGLNIISPALFVITVLRKFGSMNNVMTAWMLQGQPPRTLHVQMRMWGKMIVVRRVFTSKPEIQKSNFIVSL